MNSRKINFETACIDGKQVKYSSDWINDLESEFHFSTYYYQAQLVYKFVKRDEPILEVGPGNGLLRDLLSRRGWAIKTVDIDKKKSPDFCTDILSFDFKNNEFNTLLAFEVFEHIPWDTFNRLLENLKASEISRILFSVPHNEKELFHFNLKFAKIRPLTIRFALPKKTITTATHFWELSKRSVEVGSGKRKISICDLMDIFKASGYSLQSQARAGNIDFFHAYRE